MYRYDLAHVAGWQPYSPHGLAHISWARSARYRSCTVSHHDGDYDLDNLEIVICLIWPTCGDFLLVPLMSSARRVRAFQARVRASKLALTRYYRCLDGLTGAEYYFDPNTGEEFYTLTPKQLRSLDAVTPKQVRSSISTPKQMQYDFFETKTGAQCTRYSPETGGSWCCIGPKTGS